MPFETPFEANPNIYGSNSNSYGSKSSNLIKLKEIIAELKSEHPEIPVHIPEICPLKHKQVFDILKENIQPNWAHWQDQWAEALANIRRDGRITDETKAILEGFQAAIRAAFVAAVANPDNHLALPEAWQNPDASLKLMVRSTGKEDTEELANAGGNESKANVSPNMESIFAAMGDVVASYFSEKSLGQRLTAGDRTLLDSGTAPEDLLFMPVLLQEMIGESSPEEIPISGVMYTGRYITKINAALGQGELVVNSKGNTDYNEVTDTGTVLYTVKPKAQRINQDAWVDNDDPKAPALSEEIARQLRMIGQRIEQKYNQPMDIEFVVKNNQIYIVQARPFQAPKTAALPPRAVPPTQLLEVQKRYQQADNLYIPKTVVTVDGGAHARVITESDKIIIASTIKDALDKFENLPPEQKGQIQGVVISTEAPETSHEVVCFRPHGIPVMVVSSDQLEKLRETLEAPCAIVIDPQNKLIFDAGTRENAQSLLTEGLFQSTENARLSVNPFNKHIENPQALFDRTKNLIQQLPYDSLDDNTPIQQVLMQLNVIQAGSNNTLALESLRSLILRIGFSTRRIVDHPDLQDEDKNNALAILKTALSIAEEVQQKITQLSGLDPDDPNASALIKAILNLNNKLTALWNQESEDIVNAYSVKNMQALIKESKLARTTEQRIQDADKGAEYKGQEPILTSRLTIDERAYFNELHKFSKIALRPEIAKHWNDFALTCSHDENMRQRLSQALYWAIEYRVESLWLHNVFERLWQEHNEDVPQVLNELIRETSESAKVIQEKNLDSALERIKYWETQIPEWNDPDKNDPDKFDALWSRYNREINQLIEKITFDEHDPLIAKNSVLSIAVRLTDLMDLTIKSLKSGPQNETTVQRFATLLEPYLRLMEKWMESVPDEVYLSYLPSRFLGKSLNEKKIMIAEIKSSFEKMKKSGIHINQLQPSGTISIESAVWDSGVEFGLQFMQGNPTLEDLFSLMHQNTLHAIAHHKNKSQPTIPDKIDTFDKKVKSIEGIHPMRYTHNHPNYECEYNISLAAHGAKFTLKHDIKTNKNKLKFSFFGVDHENRTRDISILTNIEAQRLGLNLFPKRPSYSPETRELSFEIEFTSSTDGNIEESVKNLISSLCKRTFTYKTEMKDFPELCNWLKNLTEEQTKELNLNEMINHNILIGSMPEHIFKNVIKSCKTLEDLSNIILNSRSSENGIELILDILDHDNLIEKIKFNDVSLLIFLNEVYEHNIKELVLNRINWDVINYSNLKNEIINRIITTWREKFIILLINNIHDQDMLKNIISSRFDSVISILNHDNRLMIIEKLGQERISTFIKSSSDFFRILNTLSPDEYRIFINSISNEKLISIMKEEGPFEKIITIFLSRYPEIASEKINIFNSEELLELLNSINNDHEKNKLLEIIGFENIATKINTFEDLCSWLSVLPKENHEHLLNSIGQDRLTTLCASLPFNQIIRLLSATQQSDGSQLAIINNVITAEKIDHAIRTAYKHEQGPEKSQYLEKLAAITPLLSHEQQRALGEHLHAQRHTHLLAREDGLHGGFGVFGRHSKQTHSMHLALAGLGCQDLLGHNSRHHGEFTTMAQTRGPTR